MPATGTQSSFITERNPLYQEFLPDWIQLRDTSRSERQVKERGFDYLPPTAGMVEDGISTTTQEGFKAYSAYKKRAVFPDCVHDAIETMLGIMHTNPPNIELPDALEPMRERASLRNESLDALLRRINEEQLTMGRLGIMLETLDGTGQDASRPYVALYQAEEIVNWDEGERDELELDSLNLVVLDETEEERVDDFSWELVQKARVLSLGDVEENEAVGTYSVGTFKDGDTFSEEQMDEPTIRGRTLDKIPFEFINTKDIVPEPDQAPLIGLSNLSLTIYRGEADYRQALFMQGQATLVEIGSTKPDAGVSAGP